MKPGPKPREDSLTDAPVVSLKVHPKMLAELSDEAQKFNTSRASFMRFMLALGLRLYQQKKARKKAGSAKWKSGT